MHTVQAPGCALRRRARRQPYMHPIVTPREENTSGPNETESTKNRPNPLGGVAPPAIPAPLRNGSRADKSTTFPRMKPTLPHAHMRQAKAKNSLSDGKSPVVNVAATPAMVKTAASRRASSSATWTLAQFVRVRSIAVCTPAVTLAKPVYLQEVG